MKINTKPRNGERASTTLEFYSDSDFAAVKSDRKFLNGGIILLNGIAVTWSANKLGGVSFSTMEAEFVAASEVARELLDEREMLTEIGMAPELPMLMHYNIKAAIRQLEGEASSLKAKNIEFLVKFVCDYARRGIALAQYVRSELMLADLLTKALYPPNLASLNSMVRLA